MADAVDACSPPSHILGYTIRSRTRIYVSYLLPVALELAVYIVHTVADCAVSYQHFRTAQPAFGWGTLSLILIPPLLTFLLVVTSPRQQAGAAVVSQQSRCRFISNQLWQVLVFPFVVVYRLALRLFWAIEALFHDQNDDERMLCLARSRECSSTQLYLFIMAFAQSAPQIILQLYHMLTQDLFRNYDTTTVQAISLVFSAIHLAATTTSYQRFESQRKVGRHYPWSPPDDILAKQRVLESDKRLREECERKKRDSERTIASFPETERIMENFKLRHGLENSESKEGEDAEIVGRSQTIEGNTVKGFDELDSKEAHADEAADDSEQSVTETKVILHSPPRGGGNRNATDDDKLGGEPKSRFHSIREDVQDIDAIDILDTVPDSPAPLPPGICRPLQEQVSTTASGTDNVDGPRNKRTSKRFSQLDTFKDMLLLNAQLYIKENVPHPPKMLISRVNQTDEETKPLVPQDVSPRSPTTPLTPKDVTDFFLPRPTKIIDGIQQDDFAGRTIAFFGWIAFIIMRMLALATFCVFYPKPFFIVVAVHYVLMLVALWLESRFKGKLNRSLFYLLLAYVYIFVLLEFRVAFKRVRLWTIGFFVISMTENLTMTLVWYINAEFESWWFEFIFENIIYCGLMFVSSLLVYYCLLKPRTVTLIVEDNDGNDNTDLMATPTTVAST